MNHLTEEKIRESDRTIIIFHVDGYGYNVFDILIVYKLVNGLYQIRDMNDILLDNAPYGDVILYIINGRFDYVKKITTVKSIDIFTIETENVYFHEYRNCNFFDIPIEMEDGSLHFIDV